MAGMAEGHQVPGQVKNRKKPIGAVNRHNMVNPVSGDTVPSERRDLTLFDPAELALVMGPLPAPVGGTPPLEVPQVFIPVAGTVMLGPAADDGAAAPPAGAGVFIAGQDGISGVAVNKGP